MSHSSHSSPPVPASSKVGAVSTETWSYQIFGDQNFWRGGALAWWYRVTAPADALPGATFAQRDVVRRGRIASAIMLFLALILIAVAAIGWFGPNKQIFYTALIVWAAIGICVILNRRKHVNLVGLLLCLSINTGMYLSILRAPSGLGLNDKDILYLLVFSELFIGAILPSPWIAVPLGINLLFSTYELFVAPHAADLAALPPTSLFTILIRVFQVHLFVGGVLWILNSHARANTERANQAEETARLHHDMAELRATRDQETRQLAQALGDVEATLTQVVRGKLTIRVPNQQGGKFWTLGGLINSLLNRYQRAVQEAREVQILRLAAHQHRGIHQTAQRLMQEQALLQETLEQAIRERRPLLLPPELILLEPLLHALEGHYLLPASEPASTWFQHQGASVGPGEVVITPPPVSPSSPSSSLLSSPLGTPPLSRPTISSAPLPQQLVTPPSRASHSLHASSFVPVDLTIQEVPNDTSSQQYL